MRICKNCKVQVLDDEAKFCTECGANLISGRRESSSVSLSQANESKEVSSVRLCRGQRADIKTPALIVELGWNKSNYHGSFDFELDSAAFLLKNDGKVTQEDDFIFYNNPVHHSKSAKHLGNKSIGMSNIERIQLDLNKIPNFVEKISFTITIHEAGERLQSFNQVSDTFIRLIDNKDGNEILRYELEKDFSLETAIVAAEIYRHKNKWKFKAVGAGFSGGLAALCLNFGIDAIN